MYEKITELRHIRIQYTESNNKFAIILFYYIEKVLSLVQYKIKQEDLIGEFRTHIFCSDAYIESTYNEEKKDDKKKIVANNSPATQNRTTAEILLRDEMAKIASKYPGMSASGVLRKARSNLAVGTGSNISSILSKYK